MKGLLLDPLGLVKTLPGCKTAVTRLSAATENPGRVYNFRPFSYMELHVMMVLCNREWEGFG